MARDLNPHQQKIVKRYYEHHETIQSTKLAEIVSDLWLADDATARKRLWGRAEKALLQLGADRTAIDRVVASDSAEALAALMARIEGASKGGSRRR